MSDGELAPWEHIALGFERVQDGAGSDHVLARVVGGAAPWLRVRTLAGTVDALLPGSARLWGAASRPVVGDWVQLDRRPDRHVVAGLVPRLTHVSRRSTRPDGRPQVLAANVDVVFVCVPAGEVSPYLVESLLGVAVSGGARARLLVTKVDGATRRDMEAVELLVGDVGQEHDALFTSAVTGRGLDEVAAALAPDNTGVFIGASGVGKSTITNWLLGDARVRTGAVKSGSGEGRHTTTATELFCLRSGGVVIDTPGLRRVVPELTAEVREATYADVAEAAGSCRFSDCTHTAEPDCGVRAAVATGELSEERVAREQRMRKEERRQALARDKRAAAEEHRKVVVVAKAAKRRHRGRR